MPQIFHNQILCLANVGLETERSPYFKHLVITSTAVVISVHSFGKKKKWNRSGREDVRWRGVGVKDTNKIRKHLEIISNI